MYLLFYTSSESTNDQEGFHTDASQSEGGIRESVRKPISVAISVENGNMPIVWE